MRRAGGHLKDAVGVCAHELADPQLAIFVARLLEPEQGALLGALLANELLPREHAFFYLVSGKTSVVPKSAKPS